MHEQAFAGLVDTFHRLNVARDADPVDPVLIADLRTSVCDRRIALGLANGLPIWMLDRNGNPVIGA